MKDNVNTKLRWRSQLWSYTSSAINPGAKRRAITNPVAGFDEGHSE